MCEEARKIRTTNTLENSLSNNVVGGILQSISTIDKMLKKTVSAWVEEYRKCDQLNISYRYIVNAQLFALGLLKKYRSEYFYKTRNANIQVTVTVSDTTCGVKMLLAKLNFYEEIQLERNEGGEESSRKNVGECDG